MTEGYLHTGAHVVGHPTPGSAATGVVIVPPFGFEDVASHRGRRAMANLLAERGHPVLRLDLPGVGDSGGSYGDPGLFDAWVTSVEVAARVLRADTGCPRVAVLGLGLGGLVAALAAAADAVDDLILWSVPARGRTLLRQVRAFALLQGASPPEPDVTGARWFYGYPLSAETTARLESLDVAGVPLARPDRRALVLGADRLDPDARLLEALRAGAVEVTVAPGDGYAALVGNPQTSVTPRAVVETIASWLAADPVSPAAGAAGSAPATSPGPAVLPALDLGDAVTEEPLALPTSGGAAAAIVTRPAQPAATCLVLLNAGANRRSGPNRMWVRAARAAARAGVCAVRVDLPGIGDADGPDDWTGGDPAFYTRDHDRHVTEVLDGLAAAGIGERYVVGGLCSGAYWAFWAGQRDPRVDAVVLLNPRALVWEPWRGEVAAAHDLHRLRTARTWKRLLTGRVNRDHARQVLAATGRRALRARTTWQERRAGRQARAAGGDSLDACFDRLRDNGVRTVLAFSAVEPLLGELDRDGRLADTSRWPNLEVRLLGGPGEVHTLAPPDLQDAASELFAVAVSEARAH